MTIAINTLEDHSCNKQIDALLDNAYNQNKIIETKDLDIHHCHGCNECWLKTPGQCVVKDDNKQIIKQEINPQKTSRANAFDLWMSSPMPMVTLVKTLDVSHILKCSKKHHLSFNMLLCWCIGKAASRIEEFFTLPEQGKLFRYDCLAVNVIVPNRDGGINSCDILYSDDLQQFYSDYQNLTRQAAEKCKSFFLEDAMIVGTSAMIETELDCIVNQYTDKFCNPMVMWGKYRKGWLRTTLPISFQFHHVQMDGRHAARFLELLQIEINNTII